MIFEIRKYYIFLIFLLMHALFWMNYDGSYSDGRITTFISGDWQDVWRKITQLEDYSASLPYSKIFYVIEEITGISLYIGMIVFSLLNTFLFLALVKTLEIFDKEKYSVLVVLILLFAPSSIPGLLGMSKDNLSFLSFALILLMIAKIFSGKPLSILKASFLYIIGIYLTLLSRDIFVWYITLSISLALFFSFFLLLSKSFSYKRIFPLLLIFLVHMSYFYVDFNNSDYKIRATEIRATEWYSDGQLKSEINYAGSKLEGKWSIWAPSGHLLIEKNYTNNNLDGINFEWYLNKQLKSESNYKKGKLDGLLREWNESGQLIKSFNYKKGILNGEASEKYESGIPKFEANYINGKIEIKSGMNFIKWHEDGQLIENYIDGKKEGLWVDKFDSGLTKSFKNYKNDMLNGKSTEWLENGQIKIIKNYKNGNLISAEYANQQLQSESSYINDKLEGKRAEWYRNGQKRSESSYKNNKLEGKRTQWHRNGQISSETIFKKGNLINTWSLFNVNGQLIEKIVDGNKEGTWYKLHDDGAIKSIVNYKNNKLEGSYKEWDLNGKLKASVNYKNGKLDGPAIVFHKSSLIKSETNYKDGKSYGKLIERFANGQIKSETNWEFDNQSIIGFKSTIQEISNNNNEVRDIKKELILNEFPPEILQIKSQQIELNQTELNQTEPKQTESIQIESIQIEEFLDVPSPKIVVDGKWQGKSKQELEDFINLQRKIYEDKSQTTELSKMNNIPVWGKVTDMKDWYFSKIRLRKFENLFCCGDAELNYDDDETLMLSDFGLMISHIPKMFFAPNLLQILSLETSKLIKVIFFLETLFYYILAIGVLLYILRPKLFFKKICFLFILLTCMFVTILADSNYGSYLRHAFIFNKLFLGLGFLNLLYFIKPNFQINIKKGLL